MFGIAYGTISLIILRFVRKNPKVILIVGALLTIIGIAAIYSVSIYESFDLTLKQISRIGYGDPSNLFYFVRQLRNLAIGLVMAIITFYIPIKSFQNKWFLGIVISMVLILQILVFVPGVGQEFNGARGWIDIFGITTIQPSEFFKLAYVLFFSNRLIRKKNSINKNNFYVNFLIINAIALGVFLMIPDLGTALILGLTGLIMYWYIGANWKHILMTIGIGIGAGLMGRGILSAISPKFQYIAARMTYFLSSDTDPQNRQIGRQNQQALIAIGGGGVRGQGYGKGLQKFGYIPEAQSDFIFAAFSEEIGLVGNIVLLSLYFYLCWYFLTALSQIKDEYSKTIGIGIIALIIVQMFVNIGVNTRILPNTGLTLPFISYGGTAIMVNLIEIVILYKIIKKNSFVSGS